MNYLIIAVIVLGALALGGIAYILADKKGYQNPNDWFFKGAIVGFIILMSASFLVKKRKERK